MPIVAATDETIKRAAEALARGNLVAFPTETVYGLGANALDAAAVAKVFAAKERPRFNPLIVHVLGEEEAETHAIVNASARKLMDAFWPGPLTLVLPRRAGCEIADLVSAGLDTIALRAPRHDVARALLEAAKVPIAAPSANRSGRVSPTTAAHVEAELGSLPAMILDGGASALGLELTVLGVANDKVTLASSWGPCARDDRDGCLGVRLAAPKTGAMPEFAGAARRPLRARHAAPPQRRSPATGRGPARLRPRCAGVQGPDAQSQSGRRSDRSRREFLCRAAGASTVSRRRRSP